MFVLCCLLLVLVHSGHSCQETTLASLDGGVVVGRTMEFSTGNSIKTMIITTPENMVNKVPHNLPHCKGEAITFTNKHRMMTLRTKYSTGQLLNSTVDGMNEAGLSASLLWFKAHARYLTEEEIREDDCDNAIPQTQLVLWIVSKYETVKQIKADLDNGVFVRVWGAVDIGIVMPVHFNIVDKTGAGLVLEHGREGLRWYDNTVGVVTNSPPYSWHLDNLRLHPAYQNNDKDREGFKYTSPQGEEMILSQHWTGSGLLGLPGDYTSPSRFVKAATLLQLINKPATTDQAIVETFHLLNAADVPKGLIKTPPRTGGPDKELDSYTWWVVVKDMTRGCIYMRDYQDLSIRRLCFQDMANDTHQNWIDLEREEFQFSDVSGELKEFKEESFRDKTEL